MLFPDPSCVASETIQRISDSNIYQLIGAEWVAIITISFHGNWFVDAYKDIKGLGYDIPQAFLEEYREILRDGPKITATEYHGVHFLSLRFRTSDRYACYNIYAKRKKPFQKKDIEWLQIYSRANLELTRLSNEIIQDKEYINTVFDSTSSSILALNASGYIIMSNRAAKEALCLPEDSAGASWINLFEEKKRPVLLKTIKDAMNPQFEEQRGTLKLTFKDKIFNVNISPLRDSKENISGVVVLADDITNRMLTELELEQLKQFGLLGDIAAGLAHDIKNPLTSILGCARIATKDGCTTEIKDQMMHVIKYEAERINNVVRQMLSYNEWQSRDTNTLLDLNNLLRSCITMVERRKLNRAIEISANLDPNIPQFRANSTHMQQIFLNVLLNALQSINGCGKICVVSKFGHESQRIEVSITDTGTGICPDIENNIFDPFFTTKENGTGLGLFIVKRTLNHYRGTIDFAPGKDGGTVCTIRFVKPM